MKSIRSVWLKFRVFSARNKSWRGSSKLTYREVKAFSEYLEDHYQNNERELTNEDNLQLAFLKTFPNNICLAADESLEYPFYLMVKDKLLLKVHGSSVVTLFAPKPKWVCCQNLVLSSITGRPMARVLVPIKEELLKKANKTEHRKALKMDQEKLPQKLIELDIPTAILRFFRAKNHNEVIQRELVNMKAYLETDEDLERIVYFYAKEKERAEEQRSEIINMKMKLSDYAHEMSRKKHYLFAVSDRTKMQVNERGIVIDVLNSQQFLSFAIKTINPNYKTEVAEIAEELEIPESNFFIIIARERGYTMVHLNNKTHAKILFDYMSKLCRKRGIGSRLF